MMGEIEQTLNTYDEPTLLTGDEQHLLALDPFDVGHGSHRVSPSRLTDGDWLKQVLCTSSVGVIDT